MDFFSVSRNDLSLRNHSTEDLKKGGQNCVKNVNKLFQVL